MKNGASRGSMAACLLFAFVALFAPTRANVIFIVSQSEAEACNPQLCLPAFLCVCRTLAEAMAIPKNPSDSILIQDAVIEISAPISVTASHFPRFITSYSAESNTSFRVEVRCMPGLVAAQQPAISFVGGTSAQNRTGSVHLYGLNFINCERRALRASFMDIFRIEHCSFSNATMAVENSTVPEGGGAVIVEGVANVTVQNSLFSRLSVQRGGAGIAAENCDFILMDETEFSDNDVVNYDYLQTIYQCRKCGGAAMFNRVHIVILKNCTFERNRSHFGGNALVLDNLDDNSFGYVNILDSSFTDNGQNASITPYAGAIYVAGLKNEFTSTFYFHNCQFVRNIGTNSDYDGAANFRYGAGAVYFDKTQALSYAVEDCTFIENVGLNAGAILADLAVGSIQVLGDSRISRNRNVIVPNGDSGIDFAASFALLKANMSSAYLLQLQLRDIQHTELDLSNDFSISFISLMNDNSKVYFLADALICPREGLEQATNILAEKYMTVKCAGVPFVTRVNILPESEFYEIDANCATANTCAYGNIAANKSDCDCTARPRPWQTTSAPTQPPLPTPTVSPTASSALVQSTTTTAAPPPGTGAQASEGDGDGNDAALVVAVTSVIVLVGVCTLVLVIVYVMRTRRRKHATGEGGATQEHYHASDKKSASTFSLATSELSPRRGGKKHAHSGNDIDASSLGRKSRQGRTPRRSRSTSAARASVHGKGAAANAAAAVSAAHRGGNARAHAEYEKVSLATRHLASGSSKSSAEDGGNVYTTFSKVLNMNTNSTSSDVNPLAASYGNSGFEDANEVFSYDDVNVASSGGGGGGGGGNTSVIKKNAKSEYNLDGLGDAVFSYESASQANSASAGVYCNNAIPSVMQGNGNYELAPEVDSDSSASQYSIPSLATLSTQSEYTKLPQK